MENKTALKKKTSKFTLIGEVKLNNYSFKLDEESDNHYIYSKLNLGIDCGEKHGVIYGEMMGGYFSPEAKKKTVIYTHGKDENDRTDFNKRIEVSWEDRNDEEILSEIGNNEFITVGLETDTHGKLYYKKFLSEYDAIQYIKENITDNEVLNVKGEIEYGLYDGRATRKLKINSVVKSRVDDRNNYTAKFIQTILLDSDSILEIDNDKGTLLLDAYVVQYLPKYNGKEFKKTIAIKYPFEFKLPEDKVNAKKAITSLFKVKKGVTEGTFNGELIEGGSIVQATIDDLSDDIKNLVNWGVMDLDKALAECTESTKRERRMVIISPYIQRKHNDDGTITPIVQLYPEQYVEEDLVYELEEDKEPCVANDAVEAKEADALKKKETPKEKEEKEPEEDLNDFLASLNL